MTTRRQLVRVGVRNVLRDYWAGTTVGHIDDSFRSAGFEPNPEFVPRSSGQRRGLVDQFYANIDWTNSDAVNRFLADVLQPVLVSLQTQADRPGAGSDYAATTLGRLVKLLELDGYSTKDGRIRLVGSTALIDQARRAGDVTALTAMLPRLEDADDDPWLAIGTAKEIVEHIARVIISKGGSPEPSRDTDLGELTRTALKMLDLLPADVPDTKKGSESIKRVLQGLVQIVQGTGELRNLYGTGHGRAALARVYGRHARLVVGAALAWSHFVSETWDARVSDKRRRLTFALRYSTRS